VIAGLVVMRLLPTRNCQPGMKLGKKIYNEDGHVLLGTNVELTQTLITRLLEHGIDLVYIQDPFTEDVVPADMLSDETRIKSMKTIRTQFRQLMENAQRKKTVSSSDLGGAFREVLNLVIDDLNQNQAAIIMLGQMQITDYYLYQHSLNVCMYTVLLGMKHGYTRDQLMILGLGALLHDIGKTKIPLEMLLKPGKLTEEEIIQMQRHPELGFQILKDEPNVSLLSAHCALQHHERVDGSGYPRGLKGGDIHEYARWIGMVDVFDALTTHRSYRNAMLPHEAMEVLYAGSGTQFDKDKLEMFRDRIAIYPLGIEVRLSTGETGVVVDLNSNVPHRPIVRILSDAYGENLNVPYEVDLSKHLTLMVTGVPSSQSEICS
jgi:HD-GYP domain-containing protein (c-di-GMP phosphodiesterase class II)